MTSAVHLSENVRRSFSRRSEPVSESPSGDGTQPGMASECLAGHGNEWLLEESGWRPANYFTGVEGPRKIMHGMSAWLRPFMDWQHARGWRKRRWRQWRPRNDLESIISCETCWTCNNILHLANENHKFSEAIVKIITRGSSPGSQDFGSAKSWPGWWHHSLWGATPDRGTHREGPHFGLMGPISALNRAQLSQNGGRDGGPTTTHDQGVGGGREGTSLQGWIPTPVVSTAKDETACFFLGMLSRRFNSVRRAYGQLVSRMKPFGHNGKD